MNETFRQIPFNVPLLKRLPIGKGKTLFFRTGQPLGYLSSWPLFTLSHHLVVWYCEEKVYPGQRFDRYAILGDDVCIADEKVAALYRQILDEMGVSISLPKSLVSDSGGAEFAKRFRCKNMSVDFSPISIRNLSNAHTVPGVFSLVHLYNAGLALCVDFMDLDIKFFPDSTTQNRLELSDLRRSGTKKSKLPFDLWLGRGTPLNPYLRGVLIEMLRKAYKPVDLRAPPQKLYKSEMFEYLEEITLLRAWTHQWLNYNRWYYTTALSPGVSFEDFIKAPITTFELLAIAPHLVRFGLMWRLYDEVAKRTLTYSPPILDVGSGNGPILFGGISGSDFLVYASGLNQPRAGIGAIHISCDCPLSRAVGHKTLGIKNKSSPLGRFAQVVFPYLP